MFDYKAEIDVLKNDVIDLLGVCEKYLVKGNLLKIYGCNSVKEADVYFDILEEVLPFIERFKFIHRLEIGIFLKNTIRNLDRIDTEEVRTYYFDKIKQNGVDNLWDELA